MENFMKTKRNFVEINKFSLALLNRIYSELVKDEN